jgi:hypothetical protein
MATDLLQQLQRRLNMASQTQVERTYKEAVIFTDSQAAI